jgi:hypothetical protein
VDHFVGCRDWFVGPTCRAAVKNHPGAADTLETPPITRRITWSWVAGFALPLILIVGFIVYVNPRKYYGTNFYESPWLLMRWFKTEYYARLPRTPDVVVLGSSRAFQMSPGYIEDKLGYSAFNAAVDGGNIGDALVMTKFMLERHDHLLPKVLLIEVTPPLQKGTSRTATRSPVNLLPYMPPDTTQQAITQRLIALFDVQQLSEAIYSIRRHALYGRFEKPVALQPDGEVVQYFDPAEFTERLERTLHQGGDMVCDDLDAEGVRIVEELIALAEQHGTSIIFYISPRHPRYYALFGDDPEYIRCHQDFLAYMRGLRQDHPNVFFLDYSHIDSIGGTATTRGFYDVFHISEYNGNLIIDAAADTIRRAYAVAIQQRVQR